MLRGKNRQAKLKKRQQRIQIVDKERLEEEIAKLRPELSRKKELQRRSRHSEERIREVEGCNYREAHNQPLVE